MLLVQIFVFESGSSPDKDAVMLESLAVEQLTRPNCLKKARGHCVCAGEPVVYCGAEFWRDGPLSLSASWQYRMKGYGEAARGKARLP